PCESRSKRGNYGASSTGSLDCLQNPVIDQYRTCQSVSSTANYAVADSTELPPFQEMRREETPQTHSCSLRMVRVPPLVEENSSLVSPPIFSPQSPEPFEEPGLGSDCPHHHHRVLGSPEKLELEG